jgi:exopolysaccharide biosynthesis polyprenyl glycosylphosphotransferase
MPKARWFGRAKGSDSHARRPGLTLAFSERKLLLLIGDLLLINTALLLGLGLAPRVDIAFSLSTVLSKPIWFVTLTGLWWIVATVLETYDLRESANRILGPLAAVKTLIVVAVLYFFVPYFSAPLTSTRLAWALFVSFATLGLITWRVLYAIVLVQPQFRRKVLIVGAGEAGSTIVSVIQKEYPADYDVVGLIDDDGQKQNSELHGVPVLGDRYDLVGVLRREGIEEVVLAITHEREIHPQLFQALMDCHELGVTVTPMAHFYEQLTGRVPVEHIGQQLYALLPLNSNPGASVYRLFSRAVDLVLAVLGLFFLALMLPLIAVIVRMDSPGPLFYRQTRVGKGGRFFDCVKFRTMVQDAERPGEAVWAQKGDSRITRFGRVARRIRLDEAPQLWNVLKGEMSFIGPRPERPEFVEELELQIPFYRSRHAIRPGITGWAQINYGYGNSVEDALTKLQYDLFYIKHRSPRLDTIVVVRTIRTVLTFSGT